MTTNATQQGLTPAQIREAHCFTQADVVRAVAITAPTLRSLESGGNVNVKKIRAVARFYGIPTAKLVEAMENVRGAA